MTTHKIDGVKDMHLPCLTAAGVGEVRLFVGGGEGEQAERVGGGVADRVQHLHVSNVVDEQALLQAHHQPLARQNKFIYI